MKVLETPRLALRQFSVDDDELILELLNEPSFIENIGDKNVRTRADARQYLLRGPVDSYERFGFGLYRVELKSTGTPIGMCGLVKRESLDDVDIGFALLSRFWSQGYAAESAAAVKHHAMNALGLGRLVAITAPDNRASIRVLETIGMRYERMVRLAGAEAELKLFTTDP